MDLQKKRTFVYKYGIIDSFLQQILNFHLIIFQWRDISSSLLIELLIYNKQNNFYGSIDFAKFILEKKILKRSS